MAVVSNKDRKPLLSRLGTLFKRKNRPANIPEDLYNPVTKDTLSEQFSNSVSTVVDHCAVGRVVQIEDKNTNIVEELEEQACDHNIVARAGTAKDWNSLTIATGKNVELSTLQGTEVFPESLTTLDPSTSELLDHEHLLDSARSVHSTLVEVFTEALTKAREAKLNKIRHARLNPDSAEDLEGMDVEMEHVIPRQSRPEKVIEVQPFAPSQTAHLKSHRRKSLKPVLTRSFSSQGRCQIRPFGDQSNLNQHYSLKALPAIPQGSGVLSLYTRPVMRRARITRSDLFKENLTTPIAKRRGSCPLHLIGTGPDETAVLAESSKIRVANVNHLLGALFFLYLIGGGRRFYDKRCVTTLQQPGTRCLSIEHPIIGFPAEFPKAKLDIHKAAAIEGRLTSRARYVTLPYEDACFDVIQAHSLGTTVLDEDWPATLRELRRILKPGGRLELTAFSTAWLNSGPGMTRQQKKYAAGLVRDGFPRELTETLPYLVEGAGYAHVDLVHLSVPVGWGGTISNIWNKYYEPLRTFREQEVACQWTEEETPAARWREIASEVLTHRASRGILLVVATK